MMMMPGSSQSVILRSARSPFGKPPPERDARAAFDLDHLLRRRRKQRAFNHRLSRWFRRRRCEFKLDPGRLGLPEEHDRDVHALVRTGCGVRIQRLGIARRDVAASPWPHSNVRRSDGRGGREEQRVTREHAPARIVRHTGYRLESFFPSSAAESNVEAEFGDCSLVAAQEAGNLRGRGGGGVFDGEVREVW